MCEIFLLPAAHVYSTNGILIFSDVDCSPLNEVSMMSDGHHCMFSHGSISVLEYIYFHFHLF